MCFWIFSVPIMLIFRSYSFICNAGFLPSRMKAPTMIFVVQSTNSLMWITFFTLFFYDQYYTDEEEPKLSPIPLTVAVVLVASRFMQISVRHGLTPAI